MLYKVKYRLGTNKMCGLTAYFLGTLAPVSSFSLLKKQVKKAIHFFVI